MAYYHRTKRNKNVLRNALVLPVLSLFPGIGLLDRAIEESGFMVVRGPDLLWGDDIRDFHPQSGHFGGIIGGPWCQACSRLRYQLSPHLIPEFERCVEEAQVAWFVMENVRDAPLPAVRGYQVHAGPRVLLLEGLFYTDVQQERAILTLLMEEGEQVSLRVFLGKA